MNQMIFRDQALLAGVALAFVAIGALSAQEQSTRPRTDSRGDVPATPALPGSAIDSSRARYQEADRAVQKTAESFRNRPRGTVATQADQASLREAVARAFKARQELLGLELVEFEGRVERLKARFGDRERSRETIIDRRVEELLDPNVRWEPGYRDEAGPPDNDTDTAKGIASGAKRNDANEGTSAEPTYDDIPYSQWLKTLERERNPRKLFDAVKALKTMPDVHDAPRLAKGYFRALRTLPLDGMALDAIDDAPETLSALLALQALPARPVADALIDEIGDGQRFIGSRMAIGWILSSALGDEQSEFLDFRYIGGEVTRRADGVLRALVANQERAFDFAIAVALLKRGGRRPAEIEGLSPLITTALKKAEIDREKELADSNGFTFWLSMVTGIAETDPHFPAVTEAVPKIIESLESRWHAVLERTNENGIFVVAQIVESLGRMGAAAERALPRLREIAAAEWSNAGLPTKLTASHFDRLKGTTAAAIAKIEAPPKSDPPASAAELARESAETTFDGVEYSRWLKMLDTERKPEKLAAAMDACARLAAAGDEPRIARAIFRAAKLFDAANGKEQEQVWNAGWKALNRLLPFAVVDELMVALRDGAGASGCVFAARFAAEKMADSLFEGSKPRAPQLIAELLRLAAKDEENAGWLIAAASTVWRHTDRPLQDFEGLESRVLGMIESGFSVKTHEVVRREWEIVAKNLVEKAPETPGLATMLMTHANASTAVLGLIGKMGRHAEPVVPQLVDQFLARWKKYEMQIREEASLDDPNDRPQQSHDERVLAHWRRVLRLKTLGEIGVGAKGYALLRDLKAISPPRREWNQYEVGASPGLFETVEEAFARFTPPEAPSSIPPLLGDFWFISGKWKLKSLVPGETPQDIVAEIRRNYFSWGGRNERVFEIMSIIGSPIGATSMELDETENPKQMTLIYEGRDGQNVPAYRGEGIYKLEGNHLEIELARPGTPRPKEFTPDKAKPPEGRVVLKFDRERPLAGSRE